ncbi:hypothetical protein ONS95_008878 [Cadophora gregata]|uniref:uncharacterized protein n=1 Tax=Cadophora gregata TaxID=51156 RepID=UPI0026DD9026|nr:uncharacterized protein ONS95_008878 [Cadophora gregata]KAK0123885.1 hypothetical protein ONS95_008878 [Cadophora gregata]KAK0130226.1 hypothetical protein ONS96_000749 [Cadophora gregata f. sp. sojae]
MHLSFTLLSTLAALSSVVHGKPLKIASSDDTAKEKTTQSIAFHSVNGSPQVVGSDERHKEEFAVAKVAQSQSPLAKDMVTTSTTFPNQAISAPKYNDTAKLLFWNDANFKGDKKRYQVFDDKCYNLSKALTNYVLSAKLDPKVWYCTFFPKKSCEAGDHASDEVHQLPGGEYDFLFPEGLDFVSFKCRLYEKRPDEAVARAGSELSASSSHREPLLSELTSPLSKSSTNSMPSPFGVRFFLAEQFQGPSSIREFVPVRSNCHALTSAPETNFRSILLGDGIKICSFFPETNCRGPVVLQKDRSDPFVQAAALALKSIRCELKIGSSVNFELISLKSNSIAEPEAEVKNDFPSVQLYLHPNFSGPFSNIIYYPGTWGCVPLKKPQEFAFHSIRMSPEFKSCKFFPDMACHGEVLLEIKGTATLVRGTENLPIKTMYCSFES